MILPDFPAPTPEQVRPAVQARDAIVFAGLIVVAGAFEAGNRIAGVAQLTTQRLQHIRETRQTPDNSSW